MPDKSKQESTYDVVVVGSGPAGEGAAMKAAKSGRRVALVEKHDRVGGGCTHWGTIPSKALRHNIQMLADVRRHPLFRKLESGMSFHFPDLLTTARSVIDSQVRMRHDFYVRNNVELIHGEACFRDPQSLDVALPGGSRAIVKAKHFVVAVGSRPYHPPDVDFTHARIRDSDSILDLPETPRSLTIYGAGVIGCEYASIFRGLGVKVNLINTRDRLLSFLDDEIVDALAYHLREQGTLIRHNEVYEQVEGEKDAVVLHLKSGKKLRTDYLLWANGRAGNSDGLGLAEIGIELDHRGNVVVNDHFQTSQSHIYAVGDIVGFPSLASAAYDQGRFAATHLCDNNADLRLARDIPTGIYTSPEISSLGQTERELTEAQIPYEVGHAFFKSIARGQITGQTVGMLKILFHRESLELLGIHCFGYQAAEIIHIGQAIMRQRGDANTLEYFINTTFNYPTMAEAYRVAALNGLNRVF
ncbi:MAG: Si-specific NAD(P)(+) transhydrogenase [Spirochaetales bacterium]|nr:Si-specific NAD(P)(+) transhydrogenase [Leptospiraceae bacterium]MCP5483684.1 Si-specific NAD(P)(+) transhydrogenase [Spirochaetales bacterium]